jgi:hypothetical protein
MAEEEKLVLLHWTAQRSSKLVEYEMPGTIRFRERVAGEERVDAVIPICASMDLVCPGARRHHRDSTSHLSELHVIIRRANGELLHSLDARHNGGPAAYAFGVVHAVQEEVIQLGTLAIGGEAELARSAGARQPLLVWSFNNTRLEFGQGSRITS